VIVVMPMKVFESMWVGQRSDLYVIEISTIYETPCS